MSRRPLIAALIAAVLAGLAAPAVRAELSLGELRAKFERAVEEEAADHAAKTATLREGYVGALERLKATLGREGKLEQAAQILQELERLEAGGEIEPLPDNADYRFKRLRTRWTEEQGSLDADRREKLAGVAGVYLKILGERKDALTRAGEIRKALVIEEEVKRVGELEFVAADEGEEEAEEDPSFGLPATEWVTYYAQQELGVMRFVSPTKVVFSWRDRDRISWERMENGNLKLTDSTRKKELELVFDEDGDNFWLKENGTTIGRGQKVPDKKKD